MLTKTILEILMFRNQFYLMKMKNEVIGILVNLGSFDW